MVLVSKVPAVRGGVCSQADLLGSRGWSHDRPCEQEGRDHQEDVDAAADPTEEDVVDHHQRDRQLTQAVEFGAETASIDGASPDRARPHAPDGS